MSHGKVPVGPKHYTPEQGALLILLPLPQSINSFSKKTVHTYQPTSPWPMACSLPDWVIGSWRNAGVKALASSPGFFLNSYILVIPSTGPCGSRVHREWLGIEMSSISALVACNDLLSQVEPSCSFGGTAYRRRSASAQSIITRDRPLDCTTQFSCNNATVMSG